MGALRTLVAEVIALVFFLPLRILSRLFGKRANDRVHHWQDNMWVWVVGAGAAGYMIGSHDASAGAQQAGGFDGGHHDGGHHGGHDAGGGFDGGGFGGDIGGF